MVQHQLEDLRVVQVDPECHLSPPRPPVVLGLPDVVQPVAVAVQRRPVLGEPAVVHPAADDVTGKELRERTLINGSAPPDAGRQSEQDRTNAPRRTAHRTAG